MSKSRLLLAVVIPAMLIAAPLSAKTLVFCSKAAPENLSRHQHPPASFDANSQIYSRIVNFERGATKVIPGLRKSGHLG